MTTPPITFRCKPFLADAQINNTQKIVFLYLLMCCGKKGFCYPKQETTSKDTAISIEAVARAIKELQNKGYISIGKKWKPNHYTITDERYFKLMFDCDNPAPVTGDIRNIEKRKKENRLSAATATKKAEAKYPQTNDEMLKLAQEFKIDINNKDTKEAVLDYFLARMSVDWKNLKGRTIQPNEIIRDLKYWLKRAPAYKQLSQRLYRH